MKGLGYDEKKYGLYSLRSGGATAAVINNPNLSERLLKLHGRWKSDIREVKFDVYGKRQTAKIKLLPSVFSSLYSRINIFVFAVNRKRHFSIFV